MTSSLRTVCALAAPLAVISVSANAAFTFYNDEPAFTAAAPPLTLVDFDTEAAGAQADQQFAGIDFNPFGIGVPVIGTSAPTSSGPNFMFTSAVLGAGGGGFEVVFDQAVYAFGFVAFDFQALDATPIEFFGDSGSLGTFELGDLIAPAGGGVSHFGALSTEGITSFTIELPMADSVRFDDFVFSTQPVPAPAAMALMPIAAVCSGRRRRRH